MDCIFFFQNGRSLLNILCFHIREFFFVIARPKSRYSDNIGIIFPVYRYRIFLIPSIYYGEWELVDGWSCGEWVVVVVAVLIVSG